MKIFKKLFCFGIIFFSQNGLAEHKISLDIIPSYRYEGNNTLGYKRTVDLIETILSYTINNRLDIVFKIPWQYKCVQYDNTVKRHFALSDIGFSLPYKFYNKNNFVISVAPKFTLPYGDDYKYSIGTGRATYGLVFLASKNWNKFGIKSIFEFTKYENKTNKELNIWKVSLIPSYKFNSNLKAEVGARLEQDTIKYNPHKPFYLIAGLEYTVNNFVSITPTFEVGYRKVEDMSDKVIDVTDQKILVKFRFNLS